MPAPVVATPRSSGPPQSRPAPPATKSASTVGNRVEDVTPSHEFLNWLSDSLKGLNKSVSGKPWSVTDELHPFTLTRLASGGNYEHASDFPN